MHISTLFRTVVILLASFNFVRGLETVPTPHEDLWPFERSLTVTSLFTFFTSFLTKNSMAKLAASITTAKLASLGSVLLLKLKPLLVILGAIYMTAVFLAALFPNSAMVATMRSLESSLLDQVNYPSWSSMDPADLLFDFLRIREKECREKSACEIGHYMAKEYPNVARAMRLFGGQVTKRYADQVTQGARLLDCKTSHPSCSVSLHLY